MRIIVLGDTHIPKRAKELPSRLIEELKNAELIIHTGDWSSMEVYEKLRQFAEVKGVTGNVESDEVIEFFPKRTVIEAEASGWVSFMGMVRSGRLKEEH